MKAVSASALFCEDIRREATGRETLIGVLPDTYNVKSLPMRMRRLAIYARIRIDVEHVDLKKTISISVLGSTGLEISGGEEGPVPAEVVAHGVERAKEMGLPYATIIGKIRLDEPVSIPSGGTFKVYLHYADEQELCGLLNIRPRADASASPPPPPQSPPVAPASS
ncbi:MAG TPA: hypothetical protein VNR39_18235 [Pseudolabrys sp.]|nr:hypothetical protein [Pseudolabrys sp.]